MKLLFDQNPSPRLVQLLGDIFPDSAHTHRLGLGEKQDAVIWDFAQEHNFIIVSKDSDYLDCSAAFGFPPHVISIRSGNCSTNHVQALLQRHMEATERFQFNTRCHRRGTIHRRSQTPRSRRLKILHPQQLTISGPMTFFDNGGCHGHGGTPLWPCFLDYSHAHAGVPA